MGKSTWFKLLKSNLSSNFLELLLDLFSLSLACAFLDNLGSAVNGILSFLEAKSGDLTNNLDNLNLLSACFGKLYVELGLLFLSSCCGAGCYNNACCCANAKLFLTSLNEVVKL